tara:strand:+ start:1064 stop:1561 length:498 start_codon:yes stop_codon:yes gene_type:complete
MKFVKKNLPDIKKIKQLEKISQKEGSGIVFEDLLGIWKFQSVWKKGSDEIDNISSSILQVLSAKLELRKKNPDNNLNFEIKNSIDFGLLNITFLGIASIKGPRPLLPFYFEKLKVKLGNFPIINKPLNKPEENKMPFFSLIGISKENNWMFARGRGGGLAVWIKS